MAGSASNGGSNLDLKRPHSSEGPSSKSLLEGHYGVERRVDQPLKRIKRQTEDAEEKSKSSSSFAHRSSGLIGGYMKPDSDKEGQTLINGGYGPFQTVDLTADDDDDEILITGQNDLSMQEVCLGRLQPKVSAHLTPKPKDSGSMFVIPDEWPVIKCRLERETPGKDKLIKVLDPHGQYFGNIDAETSEVLAPIMDGFSKLRTQARLLNRRKKNHEWPHQPCSENLQLTMNLYGLRKDVVSIGKWFGQRNMWFKNPMGSDANIPIVNPHAHRLAAPNRTDDKGRYHIHGTTRTAEEATDEVTKLFDHFASENSALAGTEPPSTIVTPLLEHQKQGLTFMLQHERPRTFGSEEKENSSLWRRVLRPNGRTMYREVVTGLTIDTEPDQVYGGLLADVMGLGKTIEALALMASTSQEAKDFGDIKPDRDLGGDSILTHSKATLLISPLSAVKNWEDQVHEHTKKGSFKICVYHGSNRTQNAWELAKSDIVITTYGTVASEISGRSAKGSSSPMRQIKWFRIILDEAHTIREGRAAQSQAIFSLSAARRWCLTGTPIQNRIDDLGALTKFLRLFPYDTPMRFNQHIRGPAQSGDAAFLMSLRVFIDSFTLRRLKDKVNLPKRQDLIEALEFSPDEKKLHEFFRERGRVQIEELAELSKKERVSGGIQHHVLRGIMTLRLICAHGRDLLKEKDLEILKGISANDAIDLDDDERSTSIIEKDACETLQMMAEAGVDFCRKCDRKIFSESPQAEMDDGDGAPRCHVLPCHDIICNDCFAPYQPWFDAHVANSLLACPFCRLQMSGEYVPIIANGVEALDAIPDDIPDSTATNKQQEDTYHGPHTKTKALLRDIAEMKDESAAFVEKGEPPLKCVVFSEFTSHLNLIQRALDDHGHTYVRIDGTMSLSKRRKVLDALANDDNATILLASIKAAGQGLNLTSASRAFIMEPMWNPAAEAQAVDRIYRIGQNREVTVKRYHMAESIELKILELQKKKLALAEVSMSRNHKQLSKKETREQHMKDIVALFK